MHIGPNIPGGHKNSLAEPPIKPKPKKKQQVPADQPFIKQPGKSISNRKVVQPLVPEKPVTAVVEQHIDDQRSDETSCHYADHPIFSERKNLNKESSPTHNHEAPSQHANELNLIYSGTKPTADMAKPEVTDDFVSRLSADALAQLLSKRVNNTSATRLLDSCSPEQRVALSKVKRFPNAWCKALNRRLLADVLMDSISKKHKDLFFLSENKKLTTSASKKYYSKPLTKDVLDNPIAASNLFKKIQSHHIVFSEADFNILSHMMISDKIDQVPITLIKQLKQSLKKMSSDGKDHFLVTIRVMMQAYREVGENAPGQLGPHQQQRFHLAAIFAQSIFQLPSLPDLSNASDKEIEAAKELAKTHHLQAGYLMQILLLPGLYDSQ